MDVREDEFFLGEKSFRSSKQPSSFFPSVSKCSLQDRGSQTLICCTRSLLRSQSYFPYFMLVAFEGGSIFRAFFLLLSCPLLWVLNFQLQLRVMIFITFCGLRLKDIDLVTRTVLPKFYLENINFLVYQVLASAGSRIIFTSLPRVMVEGFLNEYLNVDAVRGTELHLIGQYYTGLLSNSGLLVKHRAISEFFAEKKPDIGIGCSSSHDDQLLLSLCKEPYMVKKQDRKTIMPRDKYPKPLVFHDGRLAFFPTPLATLAMFMWLPIGITLSIIRILVGAFLPPKIACILLSSTGLILNFNLSKSLGPRKGKGIMYVCNHRTLLDGVMLNLALQRPLTAVTYSLSKFSEFLAPLRTARLTRDQNQDAHIMKKLLNEGDLMICPEGTTCREPYLLRFSSLFAELTDEIVPVTMEVHVTMFYGTTATGLKCLDPIFLTLNPRPFFTVRVLEKLPKEHTVSGGRSRHEVANYIQKRIAETLGFECTTLTRRDKYLMLAGNEGIIQEKRKK